MNARSDASVWTLEHLNRLLAGRYEILRELGEGAGGTVLLANDIKLKRLVALKTILDPSAVTRAHFDRFRYEIRAAAMMRHSNIVQVHEVLEIEGRPVCVMEYVEGPPLHLVFGGSRKAQLRELPDYGRLAAVFVQIAKGLAHAHANGMIHRDIKPGNIILTDNDVPKILDFGIAKRSLDAAVQTFAPKTHVGELIGTPPFMSPEQASGEPQRVSASTDIYSLGATLYYCLTRKVPHSGSTIMEIINRVISDPVAMPTVIEPRVPRDLEAICLRAMEKEPAQRYPSALALAEDLENYLSRRPISARPYDFRERLTRAILHRKELFFASMLLILLMFGGLVLSQFVQFKVARQSLMDDLRTSLEGVAATAALTIAVADIEEVHTPADRESAAFKSMVTTLKRIKSQNPKVVYVYVMRDSQKAPGMLEFVAENDMLDTLVELDDDHNGVLEGLEIPADVGEVYTDTPQFPAMREGLRRTTSDPDTSVVDQYGVSLSGYSPIRDADGRGVAVLGVDMTNDDVVRTFHQIRRAFLIGVALSTAFALVLLGFVVNWIMSLWMRPSR